MDVKIEPDAFEVVYLYTANVMKCARIHSISNRQDNNRSRLLIASEIQLRWFAHTRIGKLLESRSTIQANYTDKML